MVEHMEEVINAEYNINLILKGEIETIVGEFRRNKGLSDSEITQLKADFWDVNMMAKHIVDLITDEELYNRVVEQSTQDISNSNWDTAAEKMLRVYHHVLGW